MRFGRVWILALLLPLLVSGKRGTRAYPLHRRITATEFWVGEPADDSNANIANRSSAWDDHWMSHFGGLDDPAHRNGYRPAAFIPRENPFYFALPYNDFDGNGHRRADVAGVIPWYADHNWPAGESICKNRWVRIVNGKQTCYAQWEDVGPFGESDQGYVFGSARPANADNQQAGLDLSPAVTDYLHLNGEQKIDWAFVDGPDVPRGPWTKTETRSQVDWSE